MSLMTGSEFMAIVHGLAQGERAIVRFLAACSCFLLTLILLIVILVALASVVFH